MYSCTLVRLFIYLGYGLVQCHSRHLSGPYPMPTWYVNEQTFLNVFLQCVFALVRKCDGIVCLQARADVGGADLGSMTVALSKTATILDLFEGLESSLPGIHGRYSIHI